MSVILRVGAVKPNAGQELQYGSGDEASSSYTDADVLDIPLPEHTYQRPLPPSSTHSHNSTGYFGLPYQDHNYGLPPQPSPPRPASPRPPSPLQVNGVVQMEEEVKTTPLVSVVEEVVEDSVTRCICGYLHDDGYMICCDKCSVWQHIDCMGVDRNNIPESYFCELCQPRVLDVVKAKMMQKRKREELAARNVLSDSSATDTDPEEAANAMASMGKKLPGSKKKTLKQKRNSKIKDKPPLKLKIGKGLAQKKSKKPGKKEKENIKATKPKKMFKMGSQKLKSGKSKNRPLLTLDQLGGDPWNCSLSPWVDSYDLVRENHYSPAVQKFILNSHIIGQSVDISVLSDQLLAQLTCVADVKKNRKGLKATQEIPAGQAIIEYIGKVMLRHDYDKEHSFVNSFKKLQPFVLFYSKLEVDLCVDARAFGNEARFVRRSCTPNSEVQHIFSQGKIYFVILSKKDIPAGSEITIPFDYNYEDCSYCVECACVKNNCIVSRYWKRLKNAQKTATRDFTVKRKRQSGGESGPVSLEEGLNSSSPQGSPTKSSTSPVKTLQMASSGPTSPPTLIGSPVKLSNVSTLLAASALLDGQPEIASSLKLEMPDSSVQAPVSPAPPPPPPPPPKSATSSRRGSRLSDDSIKEEKPPVTLHSAPKEKHCKTKESKMKDKESKDHPHEVKKERRPSSRRQSQEDPEDPVDSKSECPVPSTPGGADSEDSNTGSECPRKMTREERKLDAIMKAFEKMEKRQERRKEAIARGDSGPKKASGETKSSKKIQKDDGDSNSSSSMVQSRSASQEGPTDANEVIKLEPVSAIPLEVKSPTVSVDAAVNSELTPTIAIVTTTSSLTAGDNGGLNVASATIFSSINSALGPEITKPAKEESPQKPARKSGKRKRRRSRVQSSTTLSDAASVSTDEGNSNSSFPAGPLSMPSTPAVTPLNTPLPIPDDGGMFKYIKTKKHLFEEWSNKQEDENSKQEEEMFVQCLPNSHVNTMDHLQRRNSQSAGCSSKGTESNAGSAKKRWLRQAMHEVPAPVIFNHSLSVSTDSGCGSPVHGGASPNPGMGLGSPGAASPLDFVTPLKKRRLMRESLNSENNGPTSTVSSGVLAENFTSNSVGMTPKSNGVKQIFPAHRHSTDDRLLLHKGYPHQNGFREMVPRTEGRRANPGAASYSHLSSTVTQRDASELVRHNTLDGQRLTSVPNSEPLPVTVTLPVVNGMSEAVPINSVSLPGTEFNQSPNKFPFKFRGIFERMEVDSSDETSKEREIQPLASSSRMEENGIHLSKPSRCVLEEDNGIDSSASTSTVVVVNSHVYNGVNSLMDEGSEAGCVTTKSIMDIDSPAIVRVDLNAHEMEPSSLSDGSAIVTLDDRLFTRSCRDNRGLDGPSDCQVNSSEDVLETLPLVTEGRNGDICDNVCTDSSSAHVVGLWDRDRDETICENRREEDIVDSSQHVNRNVGEYAAVFDEQERTSGSNVPVLPSVSPSSKSNIEGISSSGQANSSAIESASEEVNALCDSVDESFESMTESDDASRQCDTGSIHAERNRAEQVESDENSLDCEEIRTCDSAGGSMAPILPSTSMSAQENEAEAGDGVVTESHCSEQLYFVSTGDSNVDSTSSETVRPAPQLLGFSGGRNVGTTNRDAVATEELCDSNYERLPTMNENSVTGDESSLEGLGVSSSNVTDSQLNNSSRESFSKTPLTIESLPDNAVSTVTHEQTLGISPSTSASVRVSSPVQDQSEQSLEVGPSSTAATICHSSYTANCSIVSSITLRSPSQNSSPCLLESAPQSSIPAPQSSNVTNVDSPLSSTSPSASLALSASSSGPVQTSVVPVATSPISSTAEAAPAVKKKVSLLEYRKRQKEKPAASSSSETRTTSVTAAASSSQSIGQPHKLSTTLSLFLASSSPSSATSTSPSKPPLSSSSSSSHKKQRMPTLATLPLFKSADKKEEEKKKHKPKPEKHLSLTERLRLEFGLDDCGEDSGKKKNDARKKYRGRATPPPPPPPPLHPPPPLLPGSTPHHHHHYHPVTRHNVKDGQESEVASSSSGAESAPPPPLLPPSAVASHTSPVAANGFVASSTHPGYQSEYFEPKSSPHQLVNGGSGSFYNYQQQPNITSTSLSTPPSSQSASNRERQTAGPSGPRGSSGSTSSHPAGAYQPHHQQQSSLSSSSSSNLPSSSHINPPPPHGWSPSQGPLPSIAPLLSTNPHHTAPSPLQYDMNHRQPSASPTVVSGNIVCEDHPPPPPPPPPRPPRPNSSSSSSSSGSHRHHHHHHHHSSNGKDKASKAAASSSSSSSRHSDKRSRY